MPKLPRGRLDGGYPRDLFCKRKAMESFTAMDLFYWADRLEKQIDDPKNEDDPRWLKRWATKIRALAEKKEKAIQTRIAHDEKRIKCLTEYVEDRMDELNDGVPPSNWMK